MKKDLLSPNLGFTVFCVTDETTNQVIHAEIIRVPAKFIKNKNTDYPAISSQIIDSAFLEYKQRVVDENKNREESSCYKICRYDFPVIKNVGIDILASDKENFEKIFLPYIAQNYIAPRYATTIDRETKERPETETQANLTKKVATEENIVELLTVNKENNYEAEALLRKYFSNPFLSPGNGEAIIQTIKKTTFYQSLNLKDTCDLKEIGEISMIHIYFARLRGQQNESALLYDLLSFQNNHSGEDNVRIILSYKDNQPVTEKLLRICVSKPTRLNDTASLIKAFKETQYYKEHIIDDLSQCEKVDPYHLLLAYNAKNKVETYKRTHNVISIKEHKDTYNSLKQDAVQNLVAISLQLILQDRPEPSEGNQRLSEINSQISFLKSVDTNFPKDFEEKRETIINCLKRDAEWPDLETSTHRPTLFTVDVRNQKSLIPALGKAFQRIKETGSSVFLSGSSTTEYDPAMIQTEMLLMNSRCQTDSPVFHATFSYQLTAPAIDSGLIQNIASEYMQKMGYGSTPAIVTWDESGRTMDILSLNIRPSGDYYQPICTVQNQSNSYRIIEEIEAKYDLHPDVQYKEATVEEEENKIQENISTYLDQTPAPETPATKEAKKSAGKKK